MTALLLVVDAAHDTLPEENVFSRPDPNEFELALLGVGVWSQVIFVRSTVLGTGYGVDDEYRYDMDSMEYPSDTKMTTTTDCFCFCGVFYIGVLVLLDFAIVLIHTTYTYI